MEIFLLSIAVTAAAEFGDKTQFLSLLFGARYQRPFPIIVGILVSTIANQTLAAIIGVWLGERLTGGPLHYGVGVMFLVIAFWTLRIGKEDNKPNPFERFGVFGTTLITFFLAEMGDKTQLITMALAAKYDTLLPVIAGATLGVVLVNGPVVIMGEVVAAQVPMRAIRFIAAFIFGGMGVLALSGVGF